MQNFTNSYVLLIIIHVSKCNFPLSFMHSNTFVLGIHLLNIKKYKNKIQFIDGQSFICHYS